LEPKHYGVVVYDLSRFAGKEKVKGFTTEAAEEAEENSGVVWDGSLTRW
jgi:hypothetical protein